MVTKRQSIATKINVILVGISFVILIFSATIIYLSSQISSATDKVVNYDLPEALNSLAMLEELGDMNSNLLEYLLGEEEEQQEYFGNYEEFIRFRDLIPKNIKENGEVDKVMRLVEGHKKQAVSQVFEVYHPEQERNAARKINNLLINVGKPLEELLDKMKEDEIADVGSSNNPLDVINDDLPGVQYYLELVDEAGDMLADLDRFVLDDINAKQSFFNNALQFESYLIKLKPLEQKPQEVIYLNEIERLFLELKEGGKEIFDHYQTHNKALATKAIDNLEHQSFNVAEDILDTLSSAARQKVQLSMTDLSIISRNISIVLAISALFIIGLITSVIFYARKTIFTPLAQVTTAIDKLRRGERNIELGNYTRQDELTDILASLQDFQIELSELDQLRASEQKIQTELLTERDNATQSYKQLKETQSKLVATEKMASLGTLVAGVAHEINTPLGVSVTMASTLSANLKQFLTKVKTGVLSRSILEKFETDSQQSVNLLESSLQDAAELIHSFKQVAVDQTSSKRREFNLLETINEIVATLHHKIKRTGIKLSVEGPENIMMDSFPGPLGQVITNLFNNAVLHGFEGKAEGEIHIRFSVIAKREVKILFADNGNGVEKENIKKLFDPFYTTKLGKGGSGLGLNIVHSIISDLMGGSIHVESRIGTIFEIKLPLIAPEKKEDNNE
ncbi:HAMP domain-containing histidine kinase [Colwellia sp. D2M02]|uniref:Histidine kinase n=1 Tax=Colwellia asteriadis TaxID=517723 RepID=A0ABN1L2E1_9GAMM|nr:HAMP domain-containing sensor histidine kinase [Colwellia sp. D2M02]MBU2893024.1 HAMP domain-containing histidine kinase [Colwellia sp. D2M02]